MDRPPPLPRSSALAAIVGSREDLPPIYRDQIERLTRETIPENTRRALESDLRQLAVWKRLATGEDLAFPESEDAVARFILDHSADLEAMAPDDPPRRTADALIDLGLRPGLATPRPSTLERRLASWGRLHGARNLAGPFGSPALRSLLARARAAAPAADRARGEGARSLAAGVRGVKEGAAFRALTRPDRRGAAKALGRGLTPKAIRAAFARLAKAAGLP